MVVLCKCNVMLIVLFASLMRAHGLQGAVEFGTPTTTGHSTSSRRDPDMISFSATDWNTASILCTGVVDGVNTIVESNDGGSTWHATDDTISRVGSAGWQLAVSDGNADAMMGSVFNIPSGYLQKTEQMTGPWQSSNRFSYSVKNGRVAVTNVSSGVHWGATPHPVGLLAFVSGGIAHLGGSDYIATPWIWYSNDPIVSPGRVCCNGSVVAFATSDSGATWNFVSTIASKQNMGGFASEEGPNENDVVLLRDNKTLFCVFRKDGGDGVPHHAHVPYVLATSVDRGLTWKLVEAPMGLLSARPRAIVLPNGALAIAGGRPALNLWISADGFGNTWKKFDIPSVHNARVKASEKFCAAFENATTALGWYQSSCYTQLGALSHDTGLVCYEKQGAASGGGKAPPPECVFEGCVIYCMRFTVTATDAVADNNPATKK